MNSNAVSLLEQYELEILRTWRGRDAFVCDSAQGLFILKEYMGPREKILFQDKVCRQIRESGFTGAETILPNKEGEFLTVDTDGTAYLCKSYVEGRECNIRDREEILRMTEVMARLHKAMHLPLQETEGQQLPTLSQEFEKRGRELRKVRKFLKKRGQKTDFELFLSQNYEPFFRQAEEIARQAADMASPMENSTETQPEKPVAVCHGDLQHHNLLLKDREAFVINFEKCGTGSQMRDLYRFMRKFFEKNGWSVAGARQIVEHYQKERTMEAEDFRELYYRFAYPEKFWKIVNFYYNKGKSWVPGRNGEKLQNLLAQEAEKQHFLEEFERYL